MGGGILNTRRRMMAQNNIRPYDAEIEYLEVSKDSGFCCIDTGYIVQGEDIEIALKCMVTNRPSSNRAIMTNQDKAFGDSLYKFIINRSDEVFWLNYNNSQTEYINYKFLYDEIYDVKLYGKASAYKKRVAVLNNEERDLNQNEKEYQQRGTIQLMGDFIANASFLGRLYFFKLDKAEAPVLDMIPVRKGDEGFMYDRVSGRLFGNSGSGRFILGPDI